MPSRDTEHDASGAYAPTPTCQNPLFAAELPASSADELCDLPLGSRSKDLVVFAMLGGVPAPLVADETPNWEAILGRNPAAFDYTGVDPHMIPSVAPRDGLAPPSSDRGKNGPDPIHGREWSTRGEDLQFACTFPLPIPKDCHSEDPACMCGTSSINPPICGPKMGEQVRGRAQPSIRPLRVAKALEKRAVVGSICPTDVTDRYDATMMRIADRLGPRLSR